ncbi:MAG: CRISPR-associated endonuclease Cas2 [Methanomethylovorans sp.]|nr:CRISPR-associated endonuclease Cas2 [Methanomethylovorans sp.]
MIIINSTYVFVAYDIEDNGKRLRIAEMLQYYGLVRIQYSVFAGETVARSFREMCDRLFSMELGEDDNITVISVCENCKHKILSVKSLPEQIKHLSI